jgi:PAS domain S-box-containing protein
MLWDEDEEKLLRSVALQNAQAVFLAREKAERELREAHERTTNILESITDALIVLDKDWRFTYINPRAEMILGPLNQSAASLIGTDHWRQLPDLASTAMEKNLRLAVTEKVKVEFETFYRPLGKWFQVRAYPARDGLSVYLLDVTEEKRAAEAWRESEERFRAIVQATPECVKVVAADGTLLAMNAAGCEMVEAAEDREVVGQSVYPLIAPEFRKQFTEFNESVCAGTSGKIDFQIVGLKGTRRWVETHAVPMRDPGTDQTVQLAVTRDVTARREAEERLRYSEEELRALANSIPQLAWMSDPDGNIYWYNQGFYDYTGTTLKQVEGSGWKSLHDPEMLPSVTARMAESIQTVTPFEMEFPLRGADGQYRWFLTRMRPFRDHEGRLTRWFGTSTNIDEQRQLFQSLSEARRELEKRVEERTAALQSANESLRSLSGRLVRLQDEERKRLARELHDSVGQILAAMGMNLGALRAQREKLDAQGGRAITETARLLEQATREIRTISHLLHPPLLEIAGLATALRWYVDGFAERSKIRIDVEIPENLERLPDDMELAIFRLVQECLTNIHRHSESGTAAIRIWQDGNRLIVRVEDQGKGIPKDKHQDLATSGKTGVGFGGMRERLRQLGGTLEIESDANGTIVSAVLEVV